MYCQKEMLADKWVTSESESASRRRRKSHENKVGWLETRERRRLRN